MSNNKVSCAKELEILRRTGAELINLPLDQDIYKFIGKQLREVSKNSIIMLNKYDEETNIMERVFIDGIEGLGEKIMKLVKQPMIGYKFSLEDEDKKDMLTGKITLIKGGVHELSFGTVPKHVSAAVEKLAGIDKIYGVGFSWGGRLFGNAVVATKRNQNGVSIDLVETYIMQASIAIQRRIAEEKMRDTIDSLEEKVAERTREIQKNNEQLKKEVEKHRKLAQELEGKIDDVEKMNQVLVKRELKMIELKKKLKEIGSTGNS